MLLLLIRWIVNLLVIAILVRSILSWIVLSNRNFNGQMGRFYMFLGRVTEPVVSPVRKLLSRIGLGGGMIDFAPLVTMFLLIMVYRLIAAILI